jgi:hypothetical protein
MIERKNCWRKRGKAAAGAQSASMRTAATGVTASFVTIFYLQHQRGEVVTSTQQRQRIRLRCFCVAAELGIEQRQTTSRFPKEFIGLPAH